MSRFQCVDCDHEHHTAVSCPRCRQLRGQVEVCRSHGARPLARCGACRTLARSQAGI
ncbi:hypothetical protein [Streptosporangium sp. NPDC006007]|uniref:hypothetical protein n=1 Tax=Streptosporangium sp. NPDC006007 TaxID=3154575 RepID=UPI0033A1B2DC